MANLRGGTHTTLTETAQIVVAVVEKIPGVTLVSPGIIKQNSSQSGKRRVTGVYTTSGMELIITGQGTQKVAVHCNQDLAPHIFNTLSLSKRLVGFVFKAREKKPGI